MFQPPERASGPRHGPFAVSLALHAAVFSSAVLAPSAGPPKKPKSLYDEIFAKHEKKLVWYRFNRKLPEVSPLERKGVSQPPRARHRNPEQTIVSKPENAPEGRQMTYLPVPEIPRQEEIQAPNLLAFEGPKLPDAPKTARLFVPPDITRVQPKPEMLPDAPQVAAALEAANPLLNHPKLPARPFEPPKVERRAERVELEAAPQAADPADLSSPLLNQRVRVPAREFTPPQPAAAKRVELDAAPQAKSELVLSGNPVANPKLRVPARTFEAPRPAARPAEAPVLAAAPAAGGFDSAPRPAMPLGAPALPGKPRPRTFVPPAGPPAGGVPAAVLDAADAPPPGGSNLTAAVIGVNPASILQPVLPDGTRRVTLAASPGPNGNGGGEPVETARVFVPDLMIRSAGANPNTARAVVSPAASAALKQQLLAMARANPTAFATRPPAPSATRVNSSLPDDRFEGRAVYTMAVQAANVTSYTGSWLMWFSERDAPEGGGLSEIMAPVPLRKVDPTYAPSAMEERVEGKVKLSAIIRKDGRVGMVRVLHPVDQRLDQSAIDALRKWEFEPARRSGLAVEVDVLVEIPFRVAPLASR